MIVQKTSVFPAPREAVFQKLQRLETLQYIAKPYATFEPMSNDASEWTAGSASSYRFRLFGLIPSGIHTIHIVRFDPDGIRSREGNRHVPVWNHDIELVDVDKDHTRYTDRVEIRAGWKTFYVWLWAKAFYIVFNAIMQRSTRPAAPRKHRADEDLVAQVIEYVQGIAEVKNYSMTDQTARKLDAAITEKQGADTGLEYTVIPWVTMQNLATKLTGVVMAILSLKFYFGGTMELLYCIMMMISAFMVYESLDSMSSFTALMRNIQIAVTKTKEIMDMPPMDIDGEEIIPKKRDIELRNVGFSYDRRKIIDGVSLNIPEKTTTAFVGPSGGGKTTLCHLMARFWDVQEGQVLQDGRNVKEYSFDSLMKNFSFVFQSVYLFEDTIANNIRFGEPNATIDKVIEAAKKARCHDFIMALPDGYETIIGKGGASLSGGEKQRISIARAIMKDAPIIILDEATANVDPENETELTEAIEALTKEKTIIMIAHRLKTVRHADQIFVVDNGRIVQSGTHNELIKKDGIYRTFVEGRQEAASWKIA